jgi:hypothetical protein
MQGCSNSSISASSLLQQLHRQMLGIPLRCQQQPCLTASSKQRLGQHSSSSSKFAPTLARLLPCLS